MYDEMPKTGYLHENFRIFHIRDQLPKTFPYHYHDFHKIVILLSGKVTYIVEGKTYYLKPWDILLVGRHTIHKALIDTSVPYERIILWIGEEFIQSSGTEYCDISSCFRKAAERSFSLIRLDSILQEKIRTLISDLESALHSRDFGSSILSSALFLQFMVYVNRIFLGKLYITDDTSLSFDSQTEQLLQYINRNLSGDLSTDTLSGRFYLNKYYLMHKFKRETGYTLHNYITSKRLLRARALIFQGTPIMKAAEQSGFSDYTTFSRAYKKFFHISPSESLKSANLPVLSSLTEKDIR